MATRVCFEDLGGVARSAWLPDDELLILDAHLAPDEAARYFARWMANAGLGGHGVGTREPVGGDTARP